MEGKEKLTEEASQSRLVGGRFNKQKELTNGLVFGGCETHRSLYLPARIFQIYIDTLTGFIHVYRLDGLNNTVLSQGCNLNNSSHCKNNGQNAHSKDRGASEEPPVKFPFTGHILPAFQCTRISFTSIKNKQKISFFRLGFYLWLMLKLLFSFRTRCPKAYLMSQNSPLPCNP